MITKHEFVQQALAAARQSSSESKLPCFVTVAQAALESDWGKSELSHKANNYFGIKAHGTQSHVRMETRECEQGKAIELLGEFACFGSMLDCFQHRDRLIERSALYAAARKKRDDESGFITEIAKHWATDPKYAEKLAAVLKEVKEISQ